MADDISDPVPSRMHAVRYEKCGPAAQVLEFTDSAPVPNPGHGEVLVRIRASGINPHDTKKRSGWLGADLPAASIIPHHDGAGTVALAGPGVTGFQMGQRVAVFGAGNDRPGQGTAAEYTVVAQENLLPIPDDLSFAEGACLGVPAFTAAYAVLGDGPVTGRHVLIQGGAGSVGSVAVELAAWNGATVIATVSSPEKAEIARAAGAQHLIDYTRQDVAAEVLRITGDVGVDRIVEVDLGANMETDAACLRPNGTVASYSSTRVRRPVLPYYDFALKGARLHLLQAGRMPDDVRRDMGRVIGALLRRGMLRPRIAAILPLREAARGHEMVENGKTMGNIVLEVESFAG